jgi:hypothetical protein
MAATLPRKQHHVVRRSRTSNPRPIAIQTSGTDWDTRVTVQGGARGAKPPLAKRQPAKIKALRGALRMVRRAIIAKRWSMARYELRRAGELVDALPADKVIQEREELSLLRERFRGRNTPAARNARKAKKSKPAPPARGDGTKAVAPKRTKPKPASVRELGDRHFDRAAFGYGPTDAVRGAGKR